ncbi:murein hydrolase activator EnvC family protein [Massilia sp. LjRoot122]|uniref:murein hydrolase activator EnvC family protein n=1 Tax=Massilia sp. LjRoot122 TaxID=3342257 RepID=UPI003ED0E415
MPFTKSAGSALLCALLAVALSDSAFAQRQTERSRQKVTAEKQRTGIQQKLEAIKRDIARTEDARADAADELAESEAAISDANRALRELAEEQDATSTRLNELSTQGERLQQTIVNQKKQLSQLLREHYVAGNEDRIKLLLSGDNPNRINRDLQMMAYVSQAQAKLLSSLRANLVEVEANRDKVENAQLELQEIAGEQQQQKQTLEKEKAKRTALMQNLSTRLSDQRKQADRLQRDEQRMTELVDRLSRLIREQAEAERRRQAALAAAKAKAQAEEQARALARAKAAAEKAERDRIARQNGKPVAKPEPEAPPPKVAEQKPADKPAETRPGTVEQEVPLAPPAPAGAFAALKGRLSSPISGNIRARFGARRTESLTWKGMFFTAPEGAEVRAVGPGRVVHVDWMRGWGNMVIIDHGGEYLSTYGFASAVLKRPGDMVRAGEVIASAGNTGGIEESGLYFELRHRGKAFDPASWIKF